MKTELFTEPVDNINNARLMIKKSHELEIQNSIHQN